MECSSDCKTAHVRFDDRKGHSIAYSKALVTLEYDFQAPQDDSLYMHGRRVSPCIDSAMKPILILPLPNATQSKFEYMLWSFKKDSIYYYHI